MLVFALDLSFMFGVYVGHCILSFLLWKKKQKIIAEIDLVIKSYDESAKHFDKFVEEISKKTKKKKYEWYEHDLMTYIDHLKCENFVHDMDSHFSRAKVVNFDIIHH